MPYQVLQGDLLTGKYRRGDVLPADSCQVEKPKQERLRCPVRTCPRGSSNNRTADQAELQDKIVARTSKDPQCRCCRRHNMSLSSPESCFPSPISLVYQETTTRTDSMLPQDP